jgi:3-oxoacyl-[acyl-carrier-protein] synthase-3
VFTRLLDWSERTTCTRFGDGAGAVVLRRDDDRHGLRGFELGADGSGALLLSVAAAGHGADHDEGPFVRMNGPEVYKFATRVVVDSSLRSLEAAGLGVEDVDVFVPHQANRRIIDHAARRLGLDEAKVFSNVDRYGNTSAGSIPLCLDEAWRQGRIRPGDIVLMVGFGGGLAWGSCVMEWTKERT